jgi:hypothetical protein
VTRTRWAALLTVVVAGVLGLTPVAAHAAGAAHTAGAAHAKKPNPRANPAKNTRPSNAFVNACADMSTSKKSNDRCDKAAQKDFDKVRASEGLGPMSLPHDFDILAVPAQLLAIADIERVDRGLAPMLGLSKAIDARAKQGADHDEDPPFPSQFVGNYESGNWAGAGNSVLLDDFYWMYDDGPGSFNEDCQHPGDQGCWGHRDDVLGARTKPLLMGAAVAYQSNGASMAEQFIGGDTTDKVNVKPSWATIARTMAPGASAAHRTVTVHDAKVHNTPVVVRSYSHATLRAKVTSGSAYWSVTPRSCRVAASKTCRLRLHFHSAKAGTHDGVLRVTGPGGSRTVKLVGHRS